MNTTPSPILPPTTIAAIRRFARPRPSAEERCDLCATPLSADHQHLLDPSARQVFCSCDACAILFSSTDATQYRRIPRRIESLHDFRLTDAQWDSLGVPIGLAFFFHSTPAGHMISAYPSPAGATESPLPAEPWQLLVDDNPSLANLSPDVEALLVNRLSSARDYYRVPIDECFKLVGLVRTHWRGLSGGQTLWNHLSSFFSDLQSRSTPGGKPHA